MNPLAQVTWDENLIRDKLKISVEKAIKQGVTIANWIQSNGPSGEIQTGNGENFLLVITYKELYMGNGETIGRGPVGQKINQFISDKNFNPDLIPFDHMYFLSVEDSEIPSAAATSLVRSASRELSRIGSCSPELSTPDIRPIRTGYQFPVGRHFPRSRTFRARQTHRSPEVLR